MSALHFMSVCNLFVSADYVKSRVDIHIFRKNDIFYISILWSFK